ncbi:MAG TPA: VC0807 family protein [Mycobacteriales bacterium]|nr:VC0807 family protein [Mycobacteriales bacterium]
MSTVAHHRLPGPLAIARHALPNVVVSTLVPTALFYVGWYTEGRSAAFALALGWTLTLVGWRSIRRQRIPALLILTTVLLVLRTTLALMSGSTRVYFMQPVVTLTVMSMLFLVSVAAGRPLITKLAADVFPLPAEIAESAEVQQHFRKLSFLWAGVYFVNAAVTLLLLLNLPVSAFVATHSFVGLAIMWSGVALTIYVSRPVLQRAGMSRAPVAVAA